MWLILCQTSTEAPVLEGNTDCHRFLERGCRRNDTDMMSGSDIVRYLLISKISFICTLFKKVRGEEDGAYLRGELV